MGRSRYPQRPNPLFDAFLAPYPKIFFETVAYATVSSETVKKIRPPVYIAPRAIAKISPIAGAMESSII